MNSYIPFNCHRMMYFLQVKWPDLIFSVILEDRTCRFCYLGARVRDEPTPESLLSLISQSGGGSDPSSSLEVGDSTSLISWFDDVPDPALVEWWSGTSRLLSVVFNPCPSACSWAGLLEPTACSSSARMSCCISEVSTSMTSVVVSTASACCGAMKFSLFSPLLVDTSTMVKNWEPQFTLVVQHYLSNHIWIIYTTQL